MRPTKLSMTAFGPYAGKVVLEMDKLGESGIYLITGDTGAGKTTVFDGITYALYGDMSGKNRQPNMMRSKYADATTPTEVELTFVKGGKTYTVKRSPEYYRPSKRGDDTVLQTASAELIYPDGKVTTKTNAVTQEITEILGVDKERFSQIAMIAQGDFLNLLLASTDKRKEIFRKIFKTENYFKLQEKLKNAYLDADKNRISLESSVKQYIDGITYADSDIYGLEIEKAKRGELLTADTLIALQNVINGDKDLETSLEKEYKDIEESISLVKAVIDKEQEKEETNNKLLNKNGQLDLLNQKFESQKVRYQTEKEKENLRKEKDNEIALLGEKLSKYSVLEEKENLLKELTRSLEEIKRVFEKNSAIKKNNESLYQNLKERRNSLETVGEEKQKLQAELDGDIEKGRAYNQLLKDLISCEEKQKEYSRLCEDFKNITINATHSLNNYERLKNAYLAEQAGILAKDLNDGDACPVCGATVHPNLAKIGGFAPTKEQLDQAEKDYLALQDKQNTLSVKCGEVNGIVKTLKDSVTSRLEEFEISGTLDTAKIALQGLIKYLTDKVYSVKDKLKDIETKVKEREEVLKNLELTENKIKEVDLALSDAEKSIAEYSVKYQETQNQIKEYSVDLGFSDLLTAKQKLNALKLEREDMQTAFVNAEKAYNDTHYSLTVIQTEISQLKDILKGYPQIDVGAQKEKFELLQNKKAELNLKIKAVSSRLSSNCNILTKINERLIALSQAENKCLYLKSLYQTANGNLSGKEKIMLETYIQATYFDRIIRRANLRLMQMTGGQYELKRSDIAENNRSQSGLELSVIDHYNGSERSVKTLSGGESFKASLSLALGLQEEVQSSAGGISLDTMFVDEGFGSLDEESLRQAINTLISLAESNRLVGIISHVAELKERIEKQIVVKKSAVGGSTATINI